MLSSFQLNEKTQRRISRSVGVDVSTIRQMSAPEMTSHIEKKVGHKLRPGFSAGKNIIGRGSVY